MRWILIVAGVIVALVVVAFVIGSLRPVAHVASTQARYPLAPEALWAVLTDFEHWGAWYPEVTAVTVQPPRNGTRVIEIDGAWGRIPTQLVVWDPPQRLQTAMDAGTFKGSWSYELARDEDATMLTVTERGEVHNALIRSLMLFHDNHATMMAFHRALAARLNVSVTPVVVEPEPQR